MMKLVIISDIHGNHDALRALPEEYDELWVLGDLVNYGPQPKEVVADVMEKASLVVQGNHDHAVAYDDDSRWSPRYRPIPEGSVEKLGVLATVTLRSPSPALRRSSFGRWHPQL